MSDASDSNFPPKGRSGKTPGRPARLSHEAILEAAQSVPFDELSFASVASQLHVSREALYKYFKNIDTLRAALAAKVSAQAIFEGEWQEWRRRDGGLTAYLTEIVLHFRTWIQQFEVDPALFRLQYGAIRFANGGSNPTLLERMDDFVATASRQIVATIATRAPPSRRAPRAPPSFR